MTPIGRLYRLVGFSCLKKRQKVSQRSLLSYWIISVSSKFPCSNLVSFLVVIITSPRMRWGISTLQVLHCVALENVTLLDLDALNGLHDLYLLNGAHGETIAAPLPIRFNTSSLQQTLVLLCFTTAEALEWRRHITSAKVAREDALEAFSRVRYIQVYPLISSYLFQTILHRHDWITTLPFIPSCSAEFGELIYTQGSHN
jgi:hypothetical protein